MTSNTDLIINLQRPNVATVAYAVQGDSLSRVLHLTLMDGDTPWTPPEGALAIIRYYKPDGTRGFYDTLEDGSAAISISGNVATVTLVAQALAVEGTVKIQLNFYTAAKVTLSSFCWRLEVEAQVASDADIESSDYYSALTETIAKAIELLPKIEHAGEYAEAAELAKDAAAASAAAALASQNAAAGSATTAGLAAQSAAASQQASSASAVAAGQAAAESEASKNAAEQSAAGAAEDKSDAEGSAEDAEAWATGKRKGVPVPETDPTYHNNSEYYKDQAKIIAGGGVLSVNGLTPDDAGALTLTAADVMAVAKDDQDIYITPFSDRSPAALFGGTWERLKDRFILAAGDIYVAGSTGGEATHTLTIDEMPAHAHYDGSNLNYTFNASEGNQSCQLLGDASLGRPTTSAGGSQAHNNMPPYLAMYIWIRVKEEAAV